MEAYTREQRQNVLHERHYFCTSDRSATKRAALLINKYIRTQTHERPTQKPSASCGDGNALIKCLSTLNVSSNRISVMLLQKQWRWLEKNRLAIILGVQEKGLIIAMSTIKSNKNCTCTIGSQCHSVEFYFIFELESENCSVSGTKNFIEATSL